MSKLKNLRNAENYSGANQHSRKGGDKILNVCESWKSLIRSTCRGESGKVDLINWL